MARNEPQREWQPSLNRHQRHPSPSQTISITATPRTKPKRTQPRWSKIPAPAPIRSTDWHGSSIAPPLRSQHCQPSPHPRSRCHQRLIPQPHRDKTSNCSLQSSRPIYAQPDSTMMMMMKTGSLSLDLTTVNEEARPSETNPNAVTTVTNVANHPSPYSRTILRGTPISPFDCVLPISKHSKYLKKKFAIELYWRRTPTLSQRKPPPRTCCWPKTVPQILPTSDFIFVP